LCNGNKFCIIIVKVTQVKIANTPPALVCQIWIEIWSKPDLAGFPKNGRTSDMPEPKYGTTQNHITCFAAAQWSEL